MTDFAPELAAVVLTVTGTAPRLLVTGKDLPALPTGGLDAVADRTLDAAVRHWVAAQTGLVLGYVEQLYTFGDLGRDAGFGPAPAHHHVSGLRTGSKARRPRGRICTPCSRGRTGAVARRPTTSSTCWTSGRGRPPPRRAAQRTVDTTFGLAGARGTR